MNTHLDELINRWREGKLSDEELRRLTDALATQEDRAALRGDWFLEAALPEALRTSPVLKLTRKMDPRTTPQQNGSKRWKGWLSWRPLTAAAAGIVFGMFCTSVVFGFVVQRGSERKTPLAVVQPSFEDAQMTLAMGFPDASMHWGGDAAQVVTAEHGVSAKEGKFMLRLEESPRGSPRFVYQVLHLTSIPASASAETREIEISASFATADVESAERYIIRAFAVSEARENLDAAWFDRRDEAIASATRGLDVTPGSKGWQTFGIRIQVPRNARSLVMLFGVRTPDKAYARTAHYLDDVQVSLIEPQPLP